METYVWLYRLAAAASFGLALLHLVIIFIGARAYRYFDAGEAMAHMAEKGSPIPALLTLLVAVGLAVFGLYALAAAGDMQPLPLQSIAQAGIAAIFLLRGAAVVIELVRYFRGSYPLKSIGFSLVSLLIGIAYATALISLPSDISSG
jgi:hypothetical protein